MSDVVPFVDGRFPEIIPAKTIEAAVSPEVALMRPPLALMGDIQVSRYGAVGFTLLDAKPENRVHNWNSGNDYYGYEAEDEPEDYIYVNPTPAESLEIMRNYGTRHGFKLIRYAIIPEELREVLKTNKWVGPAVLQQALEDGVTPTEYQEEDLGPSYAIMTTKIGEPYNYDEEKKKKALEEFYRPFLAKVAFYETLLRSLDGSISDNAFNDLGPSVRDVYSELPGNHRAFVSFHPWHLYGSVATEAPNIVGRMLTNIDELMVSLVDRDGIIHTQLEDELSKNPAYLPIGRLALEAGPAN